jgi:hypothetical protein
MKGKRSKEGRLGEERRRREWGGGLNFVVFFFFTPTDKEALLSIAAGHILLTPTTFLSFRSWSSVWDSNQQRLLNKL